MTEQFANPVVSVIIEGPQSSVLLQVRSKVEAGVFRGRLELPQGRLRYGESILSCARREVLEETGLDDFTLSINLEQYSDEDTLEHLHCHSVCQTGSFSYLAVCIVGTATGSARGSDESQDPRWYDREQVIAFIRASQVFPLNVPMLMSYFGITPEEAMIDG